MRRWFQRCSCYQLLSQFKQDYYDFLQRYHQAILNAKLNSWRKFSSDTMSTNLLSFLYKINFRKMQEQYIISPLKLRDCTFGKHCEILYYTSRTSCSPKANIERDNQLHQFIHNFLFPDPDWENHRLFTHTEVKTIISMLPKHISLAIERIRTDNMQVLFEAHPSFLLTIFISCLLWGIFQAQCKVGRLILF